MTINKEEDICFESSTGHTEDSTAKCYTEQCLFKDAKRLRNLRPSTKMGFWFFHRDNASTQHAKVCNNYLTTIRIKFIRLAMQWFRHRFVLHKYWVQILLISISNWETIIVTMHTLTPIHTEAEVITKE